MITKTGVSYMIATAAMLGGMYWVWVEFVAGTVNEFSKVLGG